MSGFFDPPPPLDPRVKDLVMRRLCPYCNGPWVVFHSMNEHPDKWVDHEWVDWEDVYEWGPIPLRRVAVRP